jgi:hypothetical protein
MSPSLRARSFLLVAVPLGIYPLAGCSGDDTNSLSGAGDASADATTGGSSSGGVDSGTDSGVDAAASSGSNEDAAASCDKAPTLHAAGNAGPYCPFIDGGDKGANCQANALCCVNEVNDELDSYCLPTGSCPTTVDAYFQCSGPSNCNVAAPSADGGSTDGGDAGTEDGGTVDAGDAGSTAVPLFCCGLGERPRVEGACPSYDLESDLSATVCEPSCDRPDGGPGLIICDSTSGSECPTGMTCTPFRAHGSQLGFCQ